MDLSNKTYNALQERILKVIIQKTGNQDKDYFRVLTAHVMCMVASQMRCSILTHDAQVIPVNAYTLSTGTSGYSKTFSLGILENSIINKFMYKFVEETMHELGEVRTYEIAQKRSALTGSDFEEELEKVKKEFNDLGEYMPTFSEGTAPALKQMRHKLIMNDCGSLNLIIDEVGMNLIESTELLKSYLELYDVGLIKNKLVKNSKDNKRNKQMHGKTPANVLMFGTPTAMFDGGKVEDALFSFLEAGFARRTLFAYGTRKIDNNVSVEDLYAQLSDRSTLDDVEKLSTLFEQLAERKHHNVVLSMSKDVVMLLLTYKLHCARRADDMPEHEAIRIAEMQHRHFKAMKIAGGYAFCNSQREITIQNVNEAISLVEDSGDNFQKLMVRERHYEKLAKYLANIQKEVTHVDLMEDLPFYKGGTARLNEMMSLAIAYGHPRHIVIKKTYVDGIEFFKGESLKETDLDNLIVSHGHDRTYGFKNGAIAFNRLDKLTQLPSYNWMNMHVVGGETDPPTGHRLTDNMIQGFNIAVLDIDGEFPLSSMRTILEKYTYHIYTTKSHTEECNRYRVVLPLSHTLKLSPHDYKLFMNNLFDWLPFEVKDDGSNQAARAWATNPGQVFNNTGVLLDAKMFIPSTRMAEQQKDVVKQLKDLNKLERWFALQASDGNRNNTLTKYAFMLVDGGMTLPEVETAVLNLNSKLKEGLSETELRNTVLKSVANKYIN